VVSTTASLAPPVIVGGWLAGERGLVFETAGELNGTEDLSPQSGVRMAHAPPPSHPQL